MSLRIRLHQGIQELGIIVPESAVERLLQYVELLQKWNKVHNLTAVREPEKMITHHLLDSLSVLPHLPGGRVLDVGSGAGLPGIPLALARPDWRVTLLDCNHKKTAFLRQASIELELANIEVSAERVESWRPDRPFDTVVSRAFSDLPEFAGLAGHLVSPDGVLAAMKGVHPFEELAQLPAGYRVEKVVPLSVPGLDAERHLVLVRRAP